MSNTTGKAFDIKIFRRLMGFAKAYRKLFLIASFSAVILAGLAVVRPILLKVVVDDYFPQKASRLRHLGYDGKNSFIGSGCLK